MRESLSLCRAPVSVVAARGLMGERRNIVEMLAASPGSSSSATASRLGWVELPVRASIRLG